MGYTTLSGVLAGVDTPIWVYDVNLVTTTAVFRSELCLGDVPPLPRYKEYTRDTPVDKVPELCYGTN